MKKALLGRLVRFASKPWRRKLQSFGFRWIRYFPGIPLPIRLPFGAWWLVDNDSVGAAFLEGRFEESERAFVERYLHSGMTVLDVGAHKGLYSLISARKVGPHGRVFAFEPSPRERKRLQQHLRLNRCLNVQVFDFALGASNGDTDLFVVEGTESGCNSLRPPDVTQPVRAIRTSVRTLDDFVRDQGIVAIDFVKLDVEGAELSVLKGAAKLLESGQRPAILCEVQDQRTAPWGYAASSIIEHLCLRGYSWFELDETGTPHPLPMRSAGYDGNFVAVPKELLGMLNARFTENSSK
jgi:FkbM family methyltransferase